MLKTLVGRCRRSPISLITLIVISVVLFSLVGPLATSAAPPAPVGAEKCAGCHSEETVAWLDSPHANVVSGSIPGATCEACHGSYIEGHAREGVMQLTVNSSGCADCHTNTFGQWENTTHAQAGVQCIGCHLSHSQDLRLTDERLCVTCHGDRTEDFFHTAHHVTDVTCTSCHMSEMPSQEAGDNIAAPSHDFTAIWSQSCVTCHTQDVYTARDRVTRERLLAMANRVPVLAAQLDHVRQTNQSLAGMTFVALGLGIAVGGMLGVIFMLVVGYISQRRAKR